MKIYITLIFAVLFVGCNLSKKHTEKVNPISTKQIISIPSALTLKNRIPNCDSAKVYMKNIIHPVKALPAKDLFYPIEKQTSIIIPGENNEMWRDKRYFIHINPDCYVNASISEIIDVFCPQSSKEDFLEVDEIYQREGVKWFLSVRSINGFSMGFWIEKGVVTRASISGGTKEQK
jgi:hypothetical protein